MRSSKARNTRAKAGGDLEWYPGNMRSILFLLLACSCSGDSDGVARNGGGGGGSGGSGGSTSTTLAVSITSPSASASISGQVSIELTVTGNPTSVSVTANDETLCTLTASPWTCVFDTGPFHDNPLPAPSHRFELGYYYVDGKYGDHRADVDHYTSVYMALASGGYVSELPWGEPFSESLVNATTTGHGIYLNVAAPDNMLEALDRAAPHWDSVKFVELADEPSWNQAETEAMITSTRDAMTARGLADRPIGVVYTRTQVLEQDAIFAAGLDYVGIEAYVDPPGDPASVTNIATLAAFAQSAKARIPADKNIVIVMQAYDRNGAWTDMSTLVPLQLAAYDLARDDSRVIALTMFSYARPGGSLDHPELAHQHKLIAEKLLGVTVPELSNGPVTLRAVATKGASTADDEVALTIAN
jgi:hypothetical protein